MNWLTIDDIRKEKPKMIYYGAQTPWWTHRAEDLHSTGDKKMMIGSSQDKMKKVSFNLPCDPLGGMLLETDKVEAFLSAAEKKSKHYGKHGLRAFEAAHHQNAKSLNIVRCFRTWQEYNDWLDKVDRLDGHAPTDHLRHG